MELSFSGTSWEVNDFKQNFGPFSGTELLVSTVVVIAGFWSGVVGVEPEHSGVQNICFFLTGQGGSLASHSVTRWISHTMGPQPF